MIDWHSHILPRMDDGSRSTEESIAMLEQMAAVGVDTVIATPHFYAHRESSIDAFLARRDAAEARLRARMAGMPHLPRLICGAEVRYYPGVSRMTDIERLAIGSTRLLLLEMPFETWTDSTVRELMQLLADERFTVLLAHIDRYRGFQHRSTHRMLSDSGAALQINAEAFLHRSTRRSSLRLLADKRIRFVGSDAHNMTSRPVRLGEAYDVIRRKLGSEFIEQLEDDGRRMLEKKREMPLPSPYSMIQ